MQKVKLNKPYPHGAVEYPAGATLTVSDKVFSAITEGGYGELFSGDGGDRSEMGKGARGRSGIHSGAQIQPENNKDERVSGEADASRETDRQSR